MTTNTEHLIASVVLKPGHRPTVGNCSSHWASPVQPSAASLIAAFSSLTFVVRCLRDFSFLYLHIYQFTYSFFFPFDPEMCAQRSHSQKVGRGYCSVPWIPSVLQHMVRSVKTWPSSVTEDRGREKWERERQRENKGKGFWEIFCVWRFCFPPLKERETFHSNTLFKTTALTEK